MNKNFIFLWVGIVALIIFFWVYFPTLSRYRELKIEEEGMDKQIKVYEKSIRALEEEKHLLKNDPEYLEKVIRDELGLVRPGEIVYKFVPEKSTPASSVRTTAASVKPKT
jgi:cell division protein FtsB